MANQRNKSICGADKKVVMCCPQRQMKTRIGFVIFPQTNLIVGISWVKVNVFAITNF